MNQAILLASLIISSNCFAIAIPATAFDGIWKGDLAASRIHKKHWTCKYKVTAIIKGEIIAWSATLSSGKGHVNCHGRIAHTNPITISKDNKSITFSQGANNDATKTVTLTLDPKDPNKLSGIGKLGEDPYGHIYYNESLTKQH